MSSKILHSGFAAIIGRPNAGKSTLLNRLTGVKVSIVSSKPQTTRSRVMGVMNEGDTQIVFVDTPGIHKARTKLGEYMEMSISEALKDIDALVFMIDTAAILDKDIALAQEYASIRKPKFLLLNKIDTVKPDVLLAAIDRLKGVGYDEIFPVSAAKGDGISEFVAAISGVMPEGPAYFPQDMPTDQPEQFICAELIREKALRYLREEVPHGIGVEILRYNKTEDAINIDVTMYCEKESHKSIIIGKNGQTLKKIGQEARLDMEKMTGEHVRLFIGVKVRPGWRNSAEDLKTLGYTMKG